MFTTDANFKVGTTFAATFNTQFHKLSHTFLVEHLEWVVLQQSLIYVNLQEVPCVVARIAERHLR